MNTEIKQPSKEEVKRVRAAARLTQKEAADLVHLGSSQRWAEYEYGERNIDVSRWELFLIKIGQHDEYVKRLRKARRRADPLEEVVPM